VSTMLFTIPLVSFQKFSKLVMCGTLHSWLYCCMFGYNHTVLLLHGDRVHDDTLPQLGVRLEDRPDGEHYMCLLVCT
jgi:hypothetical protein